MSVAEAFLWVCAIIALHVWFLFLVMMTTAAIKAVWKP